MAEEKIDRLLIPIGELLANPPSTRQVVAEQLRAAAAALEGGYTSIEAATWRTADALALMSHMAGPDDSWQGIHEPTGLGAQLRYRRGE